jgi:predicted O-methyltransferase YrrM
MNSTYDEKILQAWAKNDKYHRSFLVKPDEILDQVVKNTVEGGLDAEIAVGPAEGKFLHLIARSISAKRVLEVGTLGG